MAGSGSFFTYRVVLSCVLGLVNVSLGDSGLCYPLRREFCCFDFPADRVPAWAQTASSVSWAKA